MLSVIFDMDGVIFDTEMLCRKAWHSMEEEYGISAEKMDQLLILCVGTNRAHMVKTFLEQLGNDFPVERFLDESMDRIAALGASGLPLKKGAVELLSWLKEQNALLALASSTKRSLVIQELTDADLLDYFSVITGGDQITKSKPDPEIYEKAGAALGADPGKTLVLEDSQNGLRSALNAGMLPIMIPDILKSAPDLEPLIEAKLEDLAEVIPYIEEHFYKEDAACNFLL